MRLSLGSTDLASLGVNWCYCIFHIYPLLFLQFFSGCKSRCSLIAFHKECTYTKYGWINIATSACKSLAFFFFIYCQTNHSQQINRKKKKEECLWLCRRFYTHLSISAFLKILTDPKDGYRHYFSLVCCVSTGDRAFKSMILRVDGDLYQNNGGRKHEISLTRLKRKPLSIPNTHTTENCFTNVVSSFIKMALYEEKLCKYKVTLFIMALYQT